MKVVALIGSPRKNGNTAALVNAVCKGAASAGHQTEIINVTALTIQDCIACGACKSKQEVFCAINDDMQTLYPKIINADCLVLGTPVYMGQMTGQLKNFFDRWYPFMDANYQIHHLPGKKYITVTASGAPAEVFQSVTDYLNEWLSGFFKMEKIANVIGGNLGPADAVNFRPDLLATAEAAGRSLK